MNDSPQRSSPQREQLEEAADALLDHLLQQQLGAHRAPDLAARIADAADDELDAAATRVDAAAALAEPARDTCPPLRPTGLRLTGLRQTGLRQTGPRPPTWRRWLLAAAALLLCTVGAGWWLRAQPELAGPRIREQAQALLDAFHAAMPTSPAELHDARRRQEVAAQAIPVIRRILALHHQHPDEAVFGARIVEFEVYGAVLGDEQVMDALRARAAAGDGIATAELLAVRITTGDEAARHAALTALAAAIPELTAIEGSVVRWLETADLSVAEAARICATLHSDDLNRVLLRSAELAASGPRRLIGQPLELVGRLVDDRPFGTQSLRGRNVLVCFWASWCAPSLAALDELRVIQALYPGLAVVGVSCDHDLASLRNCLAEHATPDQLHFFDRSRPGWHELATGCGVHTVPLTLLLDRDGVVREVVSGPHVLAAAARVFGR
ncbi:MAG: TlpA family protein disulfide reductase [Planctomycetes bacterium]|nr:TlpA family protein disulfide reductase [Planctomycetota bacterium]